MGNYHSIIKNKMNELSEINNSVFIGYNIKYGSKCYGTMSDIPEEKIYEMPVTEALMTGISIGMSLNDMLPILIFERHDFILLALDQIINHLDKINELSDGQFTPRVIIRAILGHNKPFDPGIQHKSNFTSMLKENCKMRVADCPDEETLILAYNEAIKIPLPIIIIEHKKKY